MDLKQFKAKLDLIESFVQDIKNTTGLRSLKAGEVSTSPNKSTRLKQQAALAIAKRNAKIQR